MKLLYISTFLFRKYMDRNFGLPANSDPFFQKYLDVFDSVRVLGDEIKSYLDPKSLVEMTDKRISLRILPSNTNPKDCLNDGKIKSILREEISNAEAVLIKPASRKGMMAIEIAKELNKPYMIELTGDIHNSLRHHPNILKRLYAPIIYRQIKNSIKDALFALYVSNSYLQSQYPIKGEMCGCSDVILDFSDGQVLNRRNNLINSQNSGRIINLALVGFYQGKRKGVDTAIRALSRLPLNYHLNILGNGTEENRTKWYNYAIKCGINNPKDRIKFPQPLKSNKLVLEWLDTQDFFVLPTLSEGLPRCMVEAMSRGLVCFTTNICTGPELIPDACLFEKYDDNRLADLILEYTTHTERMKEVAAINYKHALEYSPEILRARRNAFLQRFLDFAENNNK